MTWAQAQEREFRVFAAAPEEKRLRFKPMPSHQRAFLHALAEDFGLDSESQDPEPHRHVCIFKTPRFVSAPQKTLAQCLRIAKTASNLGTGASLLTTRPPAAASRQESQAWNALLLNSPRFGLTIDELEAALAGDLATASRTGPALVFTTNFLPSDQVLITATPSLAASAVAASPAPRPRAVESALESLKPAVAKTVSRLRLAGAVSLCHVDASRNITRSEGDAHADAGGWSAVASRGSWRKAAKQAPGAQPPSQLRAPSAFVALRKSEVKRSVAAPQQEEDVEEDWFTAAEKEEKEEGVGDGGNENGGNQNGGVANEALDGVDVDEGAGTGGIKQNSEQAGAEHASHAVSVDV
ncbi:a41939de-54e2-4ec7-84cf-962789e8f2b1 [Thermothielavioides terrestris]|jgi:transcriptional repressor NF-X1|nr:a41939de-54e2-4ec7-84cf-962789e8f2b1 [Thermothielavioides terrestris]